MAEKFPITTLASSSVAAAVDELLEEEACCICLDSFVSTDPATVTACQHQYHLQCILDWSQRSKECPICCQDLVLKDSGCQELLTAVENERNLRIKNNSRLASEDYQSDHVIQHFIPSTRRTHYFNNKRRQRSDGVGPSVVSSDNSSNGQDYGEATTINDQSAVHQSMRRQYSNIPRSMEEDSSEPNVSEFHAISESIKSRFSAASAKYKESIFKGTRGLKDKILARNISVKELGRGVQREVNAGISNIAKMIERFDLGGGTQRSKNGTENGSSETLERPSMVCCLNINSRTNTNDSTSS